MHFELSVTSGLAKWCILYDFQLLVNSNKAGYAMIWGTGEGNVEK